MGLFDKLRNLDKVVQDIKEDLRGTVNRTVSGTDWPRASDPDGIDVLAGVELEGRPFRVRSEGADASGWELRERQVVELYDTWDETKNKGRLVGVTWVEVLHRPRGTTSTSTRWATFTATSTGAPTRPTWRT